jgi:hypothetical protein
MNNNTRRDIERRRRDRHRQRSLDRPVTTPAPATDQQSTAASSGAATCAVCTRQPASTEAEIGTQVGGELTFPICSPCVKALPALVSRLGFVRVQEKIAENMRGG